jgi:hypothetical protein
VVPGRGRGRARGAERQGQERGQQAGAPGANTAKHHSSSDGRPAAVVTPAR